MYRTHGPGGRHPDAADAADAVLLTRCGPSRTGRSTGRRLTRAIRGTACAAVAAWAAAASAGAVIEDGVQITSSAANDNTYVALPGPRADQTREPEDIEITVEFDEEVTVTGAPTFTLIVGRANRVMRYDREAEVASDQMLFRYTVQAGDLDADGVGWAADPLRGGSIVSGDPAAVVDRGIPANARTEAHRVDAVAPSVERVRFTSNAGPDRVYGFGEDIEITVGFDEPVLATGVELALTVGGEDHALTPASASSGALLVFRYTVQEGDEDTNGVSVAANALTIAADGSVVDGAGNAANLPLRGLPNGSAHRVDGVAPTVPAAPRVVSTPARGGAYQAGEWIEIALDFSENVVASSGDLTLLVGDPDNEIERARTASFYASGSSGRRVAFRYEVQDDDVDGDGVSVRAGAVNDYGVTDVAGNSWDGAHPAMPEQRAHRVGPLPAAVAGAPVVTTVGPYAVGERIVVEVRFTAAVYVSSSGDDPVAFRMRIGDAVRQMAYQGGSGSQTLRFAYTVVAGETDDDGISYAANALVGGNVITDGEGRLVDPTLRPARLSAHLVDGVAPILRLPAADAVEIVSDPGADETYRVHDTIAVTVGFSEPVEVVHGPDLTLALQFDRTDVTAAATLAGGGGTALLEFRYTVQDGDTDSNGVSVAGLSGGAVRDLAGNPFANPDGVTLPAQSGHRVDGTGPGTAAPRIVSTAGSDQTYSTGDRIEVEIAFNEDIEVSGPPGSPVLLLSIGSLNRRATLLRSPRPRLLVFGYTVQDGDLDTDGVSIAPDALGEEGTNGTITDGSGNPANRTLQALEPQADHKVDAVPPAVAGMDIRSNPEDAEVGYQIGEIIKVAVTFDEVVHVTSDIESDEPLQLMISIGAAARPADYVAGSGTETLVFNYTVQLGDSDLDGISIGPDALVGGVIEDAAGTDFEEEDRRIPPVPQQPGHRVNALGAPVILPQEQDGQDGIVITPPGDGSFGIGETIIVEVTFGRAVFVTGNPVLTLSIGAQSRAAALHDGSGTATLTFRYVVQVDDRDGDGISVPANALQLSGQGTITDADGNAALLDHPGLPADSRLRVDGGGVGVQDRPIITSAPGPSGHYGVGDVIEFRVEFDAPVYVTGDVVLTIAVGGGNRDVALFSGSGSDTLTFRYTVAVGDTDEDGVSVAANALTGGRIEDGEGRPVARDFPALPADSGQRIEIAAVATVQSVYFSSKPGANGVYGLRETLEVSVEFDAEVHVTGDPMLTLAVGGRSRAADLRSGSGTKRLVFGYDVADGDFDEDGVSVAANAMTGGVIEDAGGRPVSRAFAALEANPNHRVNGAQAPLARVLDGGVRISSTPGRGVYGSGETIEVTVVFDQVVHVTGTPEVALSIGANTRAAPLAAGSGTEALQFRYAVVEDDRDDDGISIAASALTGGVIEDAAGRPVSRVFAALDADRRHRVNGAQPPLARVLDGGVRISSTPGGGAYGSGETIEVTVTFDQVVHVTGTPELTLSIGANTRAAPLAAGSGTESLQFHYEVVEDDRDDDGISIAANALTGGVIEDGAGRPVSRAFAALEANRRHQVNGTLARIADVALTSTPVAGGLYVPDEAIEVTVRFDQIVHVTGAPVMTLSIGANSREAGFQSGSGTKALLFRYVVVEDDRDDDGISIAANALTGGVIEDDRGRDANRDFPATPAQRAHRVGPATVTVVRLDVPALSPGQPWRIDLAEVLAQVGIHSHGALEGAAESAAVARVEIDGTRLTVMAVAEGMTTVVVTATRARLRVVLAVEVRTDPAERAVIEDALAAVGRGMLWNAVDTIGARLELVDGRRAAQDERWPGTDRRWPEPGAGPPDAFASGPSGPGGTFADERAQFDGRSGSSAPSAEGALGRRDVAFDLSLGDVRPGRLSWGVWGAGDYRSFEAEPEQGSFDGDLVSGFLGVDVKGANWVVGVAGSRARAEVDYAFTGDAVSGKGALDIEVDSYYPYLQWSPAERVRLWGMLGFGSGEVTPERDGRDVGLAADLSMTLGAAGARVELGRRLGMDLALRGDAGFLQLETDEGVGPAHDLTVGVHHARLGVTGSWSYMLGDGLLTPFVEANARFDGGDGLGGAGLEIAGGVRYRGPVLGMELRGRTLAAHGADGYSESGLAGAVVFGRDGGEGWSFALAPRWGRTADATDLAWRGDYRGLAAGSGLRPSWGVAGRLAHGFPLRERPGIVTPFGEYDLTHGDRARTRVGMSYRLAGTPWQPPLYLELAGERVRIAPDDTDHRVVLTGRAAF